MSRATKNSLALSTFALLTKCASLRSARSGEKFNKYVPNQNRGEAVFNPEFDILNPDVRAHIVASCSLIRQQVSERAFWKTRILPIKCAKW